MEKSIGDIKEDQQVLMGIRRCENVEQSNQNQAKRKRGRPRGSGKLQMIASLGGPTLETAGHNFKFHAMTVQTGEDVVEKIASFSKRAPCISVVSATGPVSCAELCPFGSTGALITYEGLFEILTLTGSQVPSDTGGARRRKIRSLSVSLSTPRGQVFGGVVGGCLIAAQPIQLVVARFKHNLKKYLEMRRATEVATVKEPKHIPAETEEDGEKPTSDPSTEGSASDN